MPHVAAGVVRVVNAATLRCSLRVPFPYNRHVVLLYCRTAFRTGLLDDAYALSRLSQSGPQPFVQLALSLPRRLAALVGNG